MRLRGIRPSRNVQVRGGRGARAGGIGIIGLLIVLVVGWVFGVDVRPLFMGNDRGSVTQPQEMTAEDQQAIDFVSRVLATTEEVWSDVFEDQVGRPYRPPQLVVFSGVTQSACGGASGATGPFYCPLDQIAYLDTQFFSVLSQRMGAGGDFAAAYVVAHEVAHHVQNELGILGEVNRLRQVVSETDSNRITVRLELQADCLSGVWARAVGGLLEPGDIEEALNAARRIGDDYLQRQAGRVPQPHTFTHGTSEQRQRWFAQGYQTGDINSCDTFQTDQL
jgi:predicted metalloprotease